MGYFTGTVNGTYDSATVAAVKAFQKAYRLSVDGVAGPKVLTALNGVITTPVPVLTVATAAPAISAENLIVVRRGTRGVVVSNLQKRLTELGYYDVDADGIYDADDIAAVRAFQQKNGLTVDGVAGLDTQTLLYSDGAVAAWANAATVTPAPAATPVPDMTTTLKLGSSGDAVNLLQARLTLLKYLNDTIDGRFGTQTAAAVAAFQEANGLTADGVAGPKTLTALYSDKAKEAAAPAQAAAALSASGTLKIGDKGAAVKSLQRALITLGYLSGAADGIYGTKTYLAVEAFQQDSRLTVDGMAGPATLTRLEKASADKEAADKKAAEKAATAMVSGTNFKAPAAREVRFADWYNETRAQAKLMPNAIIYDYKTGLHYSVNMFSFGKHCDAEPLTASDTAIMNQIMGANNWTPHAVWVILSDGKVYMASTHSHGHEADSISGNGLEGHICIHFPREMTAAEKESMPYALSHQQEILRGWEETQAMIK